MSVTLRSLCISVWQVFAVLSLQLLVTCAVVAVFTFEPHVKFFVQVNGWTYWVGYVVFLVPYFILMCCSQFRRKHPWNLVALVSLGTHFVHLIWHVSVSVLLWWFFHYFRLFWLWPWATWLEWYPASMTQTLSSWLWALRAWCAVQWWSSLFRSVLSVWMKSPFSSSECWTQNIFFKNIHSQTRFDFTSCYGVLCVCATVFLFFGILCIFLYNRIMDLIYSSLGALIFTCVSLERACFWFEEKFNRASVN